MRTILVALLCVLFACSDSSSEPASPEAMLQTDQPASTAAQPDAEPLKVVTTLNFIGDWVENIGGDRVEVTSLLPIGSDPHSFKPGARAVATISDADLVLTVGLNLEAYWLDELVKNAARDPSTIVELGDVIDPIEFSERFDKILCVNGGARAYGPPHEVFTPDILEELYGSHTRELALGHPG